jgi:hypothetical protein
MHSRGGFAFFVVLFFPVYYQNEYDDEESSHQKIDEKPEHPFPLLFSV